MAARLDFNFSQVFSGQIWHLLPVPHTDTLILEIRDPEKRETSFAALQYTNNTFLWKDVKFEESWWIGIFGATTGVLLVHCYQQMDNPDRKDLIAYDIDRQTELWTLRDFTGTTIQGNAVLGYFTKNDLEPAIIDVFTGKVAEPEKFSNPGEDENFQGLHPFQYQEGQEHFNTVKLFLSGKTGLVATGGVEYLEHESLIFVSCYSQEKDLANYLIVLNEAGDILLNEKIDEQAKGLGVGTFFILSSCLFFVRNRRELVSYKIV